MFTPETRRELWMRIGSKESSATMKWWCWTGISPEKAAAMLNANGTASSFAKSQREWAAWRQNVKYYNIKTGQEVVYDSDADNAKIVTSPDNIGTYNHFSPKDAVKHALFDVIPYWLWGNSENDRTPLGNRLLGNWFFRGWGLHPDVGITQMQGISL